MNKTLFRTRARATAVAHMLSRNTGRPHAVTFTPDGFRVEVLR